MGAKTRQQPGILVIDDEPLSFKILENIFRHEGWEAIWAPDGLTGVNLAVHRKPAVILLDVVLPERDGFQICRALKHNPSTRDIPVIFLTSRADKTDKLRAFEAGAVDFVTKPFFAEEVRARVQTQLKLKAYADELRETNEKLAQLAQRFEQLSLTDELMRIANRRAFDMEMERMHASAVRQHSPYALLIADIDFFKRYNDLLGHQAGDQVLRTLGRVFQQTVRSADLVARYGGEEIAVILPHTDCQGALLTARRLQEALAAENIPHPGNPLHGRITMSVGISCFDPHHPDLNYFEVIRKADTALYQAKASGRDTIRLFTPASPDPAPAC
ncbi:MAG: diguanylate cyclase [Syntrophomonadaceae bacterium]|jgi:diguanylate cyclase (GGDEF)-like protein|nr:diguanylate cyclase [Syntrophomonadaceae bacterium]